MNLVFYSLLVVLSMFGLSRNINKHKQSILFLFVLFGLFVLTIISRQHGFFVYSDLGSYIWRFNNNDNAYFGTAYSILSNTIKSVFGNNVSAYLASIAIITLGIAVLSIKIWDKSEDGIRYYNAFILIFVVYWGVSFSAEVIRTGIAIALSLLAIAFAKEKRIIFCVLSLFVSIAFHWTEIFIIPIVILFILGKDKSETTKKDIFFYLWLIVLVALDFMDFSSLLAKGLNSLLQLLISNSSQYEHYLHYLYPKPRENVLSFISLQYIYYRVLAILLVIIFKRTKTSSILLYSYYIGLSVYTIMSDFGVVTRMMWIFAVPSVFIFYDYAKSDLGDNNNGRVHRNNKMIVLCMLALIQSVMAVNYLGYYL